MKRINVGVLPIQAAVATASPSAWQDGLVCGMLASSSERASLVITLVDGRTLSLSCEVLLAVGEPVAWHPVAEVLANGRAWWSAKLVEV